MVDVIIVGGSYAGMAAALQLGRARRRVLVLDAGRRRNRFARSSHGFLGQDGVPPGEVAAKGRAEVLAYPTVAWRDEAAVSARPTEGGFAVETASGQHLARRLILATGVVDDLPDVPGLAERWGSTVFHCPYCHGYELDRGRVGILATGPLSAHFAALVAEWGAAGQTALFLNGVFEPSAEEAADLAARGIRVERERVLAAEGQAPAIELRLESGRIAALDGLFLAARTHIQTPFADQLGCELAEGPTGSFYKTDEMRETTVPGVFACGDNARAAGSLTFAVADGVMAGVATHRSLVFRAG